MKTIIDFLSNTYFIFIFLALVSIFALIGYFIELKHPEEEKSIVFFGIFLWFKVKNHAFFLL